MWCKPKEERLKCRENYRNKKINTRGNVGIKYCDKTYEKRISEVIKQSDRKRNNE